MTVSMRVMTAGSGVDYLLKSVATGDGERVLSTPLTRYYAETGCPPGRWLGSGIASLVPKVIVPGGVVTEEQLQRLIGHGLHPETAEPLGRRQIIPKVRPADAQATAGDRPGSTHFDAADDPEAEAPIRRDARDPLRPVAGFDYTFSVPKSVSVLWGLADAGSQALIVQAHHDAVAEVLAFMEREVAVTRVGRQGVAQAPVTGVVATAYDHYDSRAADPQLHTHVVVANRVCTRRDGKWRTLDSRPMHAATVAISEHYNAVLADKLADLFGLRWETRDRGRDRNPAWEIAGVPEDLIRHFSSRSASIDIEVARLIDEYTARHHRDPSATTILKLRQQATLATRPQKVLRSLADLTGLWRDRAARVLGEDATGWAIRVLRGGRAEFVHADDVTPSLIERIAKDVIGQVSEKRAVWRRWNLHAEASRQTMGWRFASVADREAVVGQIAGTAEALSIRLTPNALTAPAEFTRPDGSNIFRPLHLDLFTSQKTLDAEARLLRLANDFHGPTLDLDAIEDAVGRPDATGRLLSPDQAEALVSIAVSGRVIDVLVGPAGAGKTTALSVLRTAWEHDHGSGSVLGLAPSATAAAVLGEDLGIATENTAKWLDLHDRHGVTFKEGQLVIIDEASLAGTFTLDRITALAGQAGAKVLLVGDWAQLQAVGTGGAFHLLASERHDAPELSDIHRFRHDWEKTASLSLRHGHASIIDTYFDHGRITEGDHDDITEQAYQAWRADVAAGRSSLLIADSHDTVRDLNARARLERVTAEEVDPVRSVTLADGLACSAGDLVITRRNDRRLVAGAGGWVRNGERWTVTKVHDDGAVTIRRANGHGSVILPADYASEHLDLGYAVTAYRAQGVTVDTSHCVVTPTTTRENLYVAMTRGRDRNQAYVAVDRPDPAHWEPHPADPEDATARSVLAGVLANVGAELSAHQTAIAERETWGSIRQLAAERDYIETVALADHWASVIRSSGLTEAQADAVISADTFGILCAELRRADANHQPVQAMVKAAVQAGGLETATDLASVLCHRVAALNDDAGASGQSRQQPRMIVGFIPEATGPMAPNMRALLDQYKAAIEARADELVRRAMANNEPWLTKLGPRPSGPQVAARWDHVARAMAAYRACYGVTDAGIYGSEATPHQRRDARQVQLILSRATSPGERMGKSNAPIVIDRHPAMSL